MPVTKSKTRNALQSLSPDSALKTKKSEAVFSATAMHDFAYGFQRRKYERRMAAKHADDIRTRREKSDDRKEWRRAARAKHNELSLVPIREDYSFILPTASSASTPKPTRTDFGAVTIRVEPMTKEPDVVDDAATKKDDFTEWAESAKKSMDADAVRSLSAGQRFAKRKKSSDGLSRRELATRTAHKAHALKLRRAARARRGVTTPKRK